MSDETTSLADLASEINDLYEQADAAGDDIRLQLAERLLVARDQVTTGWQRWVEENLDFSYEYVAEMIRIARDDDPKKALQKTREAKRDLMRMQRDEHRRNEGGAGQDNEPELSEQASGASGGRSRNLGQTTAHDTHLEKGLWKDVSQYTSKTELLKHLDFRRKKGQWRVCYEKPAEPEPVLEPAQAPEQAA